MVFDCVSRTHPGLKRKVNEDSILVRTDRGFWAVADGMGGHEAGDVASAKVVEALALVPPHSAMESFVGDSISALQTANSELIRLAQTTQRPRTIGTTIVGLVISAGRFGCFWAGDSRAYRIRDGEIAQLTRDHSLVQGLVDAGMLDPAEAEDHPNANVVTRAVGASEALEVDTSTGDAYAGDTFLLASDGLTRVVTDDELYSELTSAPIEAAADSLLQTVLSRGAPDNVSLILVRLSCDSGRLASRHDPASFYGSAKMIFMGGSSGCSWRSDGHGGFNGDGCDVHGHMWRSDGRGGFNGFGLGIGREVWRSDGQGGWLATGGEIDGEAWHADGNGGFNGYGPRINGQRWCSDGNGGWYGVGGDIEGRHWRADGNGGWDIA